MTWRAYLQSSHHSRWLGGSTLTPYSAALAAYIDDVQRRAARDGKAFGADTGRFASISSEHLPTPNVPCVCVPCVCIKKS